MGNLCTPDEILSQSEPTLHISKSRNTPQPLFNPYLKERLLIYKGILITINYIYIFIELREIFHI
jgi:hypothetical protein